MELAGLPQADFPCDTGDLGERQSGPLANPKVQLGSPHRRNLPSVQGLTTTDGADMTDTLVAEPAEVADEQGKSKRLDTSLEASGAEFLVLGNLLIEGIPSYKAYVNFPGYDLIATNPKNNTSARVQVKSRFVTDFDDMIIKNYDTDFVVFVALNRGYHRGPKKGDAGIRPPAFFVLPIEYILEVRDPNNKWGKIIKRRLTNLDSYRDRWDLIREFLSR